MLMRVFLPARLVSDGRAGHPPRDRRRRDRLRHPRQVPSRLLRRLGRTPDARHAGARRRSTVGPEHDVFWATAGGMGLTGIVTEATLQLQPVETAHIVVDTERVSRRRRLHGAACSTATTGTATPSRGSTAWPGASISAGRCSREAITQPSTDLPEPERPAARPSRRARVVRVPSWTPNGLVNPLTVRAFNELWFRKSPRERHGEVQSITGSSIRSTPSSTGTASTARAASCSTSSWCRTARRPSSAAVLERLSAQRCASFLAVLKRFEHDSRGMLGFPTAGWTLALDVPASGAALDAPPRRPRRARGRGRGPRVPDEGLTHARRARARHVPAARSLA